MTPYRSATVPSLSSAIGYLIPSDSISVFAVPRFSGSVHIPATTSDLPSSLSMYFCRSVSSCLHGRQVVYQKTSTTGRPVCAPGENLSCPTVGSANDGAGSNCELGPNAIRTRQTIDIIAQHPSSDRPTIFLRDSGLIMVHRYPAVHLLLYGPGYAVVSHRLCRAR